MRWVGATDRCRFCWQKARFIPALGEKVVVRQEALGVQMGGVPTPLLLSSQRRWGGRVREEGAAGSVERKETQE